MELQVRARHLVETISNEIFDGTIEFGMLYFLRYHILFVHMAFERIPSTRSKSILDLVKSGASGY